MPSARFDVLGIGNAIVDVIARTEEDFLLKQGMILTATFRLPRQAYLPRVGYLPPVPLF